MIDDIDAFERATKGSFREGIATSRIHVRKGQESVGAIRVAMITGVPSATTNARHGGNAARKAPPLDFATCTLTPSMQGPH